MYPCNFKRLILISFPPIPLLFGIISLVNYDGASDQSLLAAAQTQLTFAAVSSFHGDYTCTRTDTKALTFIYAQGNYAGHAHAPPLLFSHKFVAFLSYCPSLPHVLH